MAVYREKTVPIPRTKGITINRGDANKVLFVKEAPYDPKVGYSRPRRTTIGYVCNDDVKLAADIIRVIIKRHMELDT